MSVSIVGAAFLAACSENAESQYKDAKSTPMTFVVKHPSQTRATETDFEIGDRIGLYVANTEKPMEFYRQVSFHWFFSTKILENT